MNCAVVIPNWNGLDFLEPCLSSLRQQTHPHQVIVVDNGSRDGSLELIRNKFPEVTLIELDRNYGFAGGVNRGIKSAMEQDGRYVALLNNDAVVEPQWLELLVKTAEAHPEVAIVTSKILYPDGKIIDSTGDFYTIWGFSFPRGRGETDQGTYDQTVDVFAASGGASLYRVEALRQIGLFDEAFFAYYEDIDISFRARLYGWLIRYEPAARVYHHVGGTSSKHGDFARYHTLKNFVYIYTKNMPGSLYWRYFPRFATAYAMMIVRDITKGRFTTILRAWTTIIGHYPAVLVQRFKLQRNRRVSPATIDAVLYRAMPPTQQLLLRWRAKLKK